MNNTVDATARRVNDRGFSLIELLIVIIIIGLLATIVTFAVGGFRDDADKSACAADARSLGIAIEGYFALAPATAIPGDGTPDSHELALVNLELLRAPSKLYDLDANGDLVIPTESPCKS